jgi:hypothetical protein
VGVLRENRYAGSGQQSRRGGVLQELAAVDVS